MVRLLYDDLREDMDLLFTLDRRFVEKPAVFYGETVLRIFHNLDRSSEDLDFCTGGTEL